MEPKDSPTPPARPTRPGWLPPGWVVLTGYSGHGPGPVYLDVRAIVGVAAATADENTGGCLLQIAGREFLVDVQESPAEVFSAITDTTRNLPPRSS